MTVLPYKEDTATKKSQVARMFNNISRRYDLLNHLLSAGVDIYWRRKAINILRPLRPRLILDVATGTGDFAVEALSLKPEKIVGVDISEGMLDIARKKIREKGLSERISLMQGDSENLPFPENMFDAVIVAFGVRNFENLARGLTDMFRVLKPGGKAIVLEFSKPDRFFFGKFFTLYFKYIVPVVGRLISHDRSAYDYLPESVDAFPRGQTFLDIMAKAGFRETTCQRLTFGICSIYTGTK
jgi:demethylmenaquinone methyltransferase / 2-methoxy-6-polyprenyl-1,4-benzoquinol methylase